MCLSGQFFFLERGTFVFKEECSQIIRLDVSINEVICGTVETSIDETHELTVSSKDDIVAEKLRSLLQQPSRKRYRPQDLLDIAVLLRLESAEINAKSVSEFLLKKSIERRIVVSRKAFSDSEIRRRAESGYESLEKTTRYKFIPFADAWDTLQKFVADLEIPDGE